MKFIIRDSTYYYNDIKVDRPKFISGDTITYEDSTGSTCGGTTYRYEEGRGWELLKYVPAVSPFKDIDTTTCTKESSMHDIDYTDSVNDRDARRALKFAIADAETDHIVKAKEVCHIEGFRPKNLRELREAMIAGHFEGYGDDKAMETEFDYGVSEVVFRKAPADDARFEVLSARIRDEANAIRLKVKVVEMPETVLPFVESYKARTYH